MTASAYIVGQVADLGDYHGRNVGCSSGRNETYTVNQRTGLSVIELRTVTLTQ